MVTGELCNFFIQVFPQSVVLRAAARRDAYVTLTLLT
jgi:hypothetical protein